MSKRCAAVSCKQTTYYSPTFLIDLGGPKVYHSKADLRLSEQYLLDPMNLVLDTFGFFCLFSCTHQRFRPVGLPKSGFAYCRIVMIVGIQYILLPDNVGFKQAGPLIVLCTTNHLMRMKAFTFYSRQADLSSFFFFFLSDWNKVSCRMRVLLRALSIMKLTCGFYLLLIGF